MAYDERAGAKKLERPHNVILEGREKLSVSGVDDILSFDEVQIDAITSRGLLMIRGAMLHIESLSTDTGELIVTGDVDSLVYGEPTEVKQGFFARLFK